MFGVRTVNLMVCLEGYGLRMLVLPCDLTDGHSDCRCYWAWRGSSAEHKESSGAPGAQPGAQPG
eukprot:8498325-Alexandrium_andersonii.AAC.1